MHSVVLVVQLHYSRSSMVTVMILKSVLSPAALHSLARRARSTIATDMSDLRGPIREDFSYLERLWNS